MRSQPPQVVTKSRTDSSRRQTAATVLFAVLIGLAACEKKESEADRFVRETQLKIKQFEAESELIRAQRAAIGKGHIGNAKARETAIAIFAAMDQSATTGGGAPATPALSSLPQVVWEPSNVLNALKRGTTLPSFVSIVEMNHRAEEESSAVLKVRGKVRVSLRVDTFADTGVGINYRGGRIAILRTAHRAGDLLEFEFQGRVGRDHLNYSINADIPVVTLGRPKEEFSRSIVEDSKDGQEIITAAKEGRSANERLHAIAARLGDMRTLLAWSADEVVRNPPRDWWAKGVTALRKAGYGTEAAQFEALGIQLFGQRWRSIVGSESDRKRGMELLQEVRTDARRTINDAQEYERIVRRVDELLSRIQ
jgi:hypothetical protein